MLGLSPSKDFVKNFSREAGVDEKTAMAVAGDINKEVFDKMRSSMQAVQSEEGSRNRTIDPDQVRFNQTQADQARMHRDISSVEKAGGFSIEREGGSENRVNYGGKNETMEGMERPLPGTEHEHTDPIVDHLLANPAATPEQKTTHHTAPPPVNLPEESASRPAPETETAPRPRKKYVNDPYHEPVK